MRVCPTFWLFVMLQQSILAPSSSSHFNPSWQPRRGDIISAPAGLLILVRWSETLQSIGRALVLLILEVQGHPAYLVVAFLLLALTPTSSPNQHLLTFHKHSHLVTVRVPMLIKTIAVMLDALFGLSHVLSNSMHSGGATAAYREGLDKVDVKSHGLWASDCSWQYVTSPCISTSPVVIRLVAAVQATASHNHG